MKWVVIIWGIVVGIIVIGGTIWFMAKNKGNSILQGYKDSKEGKPPTVPIGEHSNITISRKDNSDTHKGVTRKEDNKKLDGSIKCVTPKSTEKWSKKALAILEQNYTALEEYDFPAVRDILIAETEEERLRKTYDTIRDITQLYLERMGIKDILQSIAEMAEYIPQGLREYDEVKQILPLHASVWNTSANTLKRQTVKLFLKYEKTMQLEKETELADIETKTEELLKNVRTAWDEYKATNGSQDSIWKLQRAVEAYSARKTAAEESLRTYGMAVSEEKKADVLALCRSLKELMDSDTFRSLEMYEVHDGEKVSVDMDGEELDLDPTTKVYWDKVGFFAADIQNFLNKWDEKFES